MSTPPGKDADFAAIDAAAEEAMEDKKVTATGPLDADAGDAPPASRKAKDEVYRTEQGENLAANRRMRWWTFRAVGVICVAYFAALLCVLLKLLSANYLVRVLDAVPPTWDWHVLTLIGLALVVFAAVPLSLGIAMVKMISDKSDESYGMTTANAELGKVCIDFVKSFTNKG